MFKQATKAARKAAYNLVAKHFGYRVLVVGGVCNGQRHYTCSMREAMAWVTCYGPNVRHHVTVRNWIGIVQARVSIA
jgi:hypothetical protein